MKNKYRFENLKIGTRFYFMSDTKKEVHTKINDESAYAEQQDKLVHCYDVDIVIILK